MKNFIEEATSKGFDIDLDALPAYEDFSAKTFPQTEIVPAGNIWGEAPFKKDVFLKFVEQRSL